MDGRSMFQISAPSSWDAATLSSLQNAWLYRVTPQESDDVLRGLHYFKSLNSPRNDPSDFPMGAFEAVLSKGVNECEYGMGVFLIKGLPISDLPESDVRMIAWGIGMHLGVPLIQNSQGEMVVNVRDSGVPNPLRGNSTNAEIEHHTDNSDIVTLLCRRSAMSGGESKIVSSVRAYNFMVENLPDMAYLLHEYFPFSDISNQRGEGAGYFDSPIVSFEKGCFSCRFYRKRVLDALERFFLNDAVSSRKAEVVEKFSEVMRIPELNFSMDLQEGDFQMLNNHVVCHARSSFLDFPEHDRKRHLYRGWISHRFSRPLASSLIGAYGITRAGSVRGGYRNWKACADIERIQVSLAEYHGMSR